jgi:hypothetical protein
MQHVPEYKGDVAAWASELQRFLAELVDTIHTDLSKGASTHRILTAAPSASTLADGEIILTDDGLGNITLTAKVNGTLYSAVLA